MADSVLTKNEESAGTESLHPGWRVVAVGDVIKSISAGTSVNGMDRAAGDEEAGVLKVSAVSEGCFKPAQNKAIRTDELSRARKPVRGGTLLMTRSNTAELVGAVAYVGGDYPKLFLPDLLWEIDVRPGAGCGARWLAHYLSSVAARKEIQARASGTSGSMKKISIGRFLSMRIVLPPLCEQATLVKAVDKWIDRIEMVEALGLRYRALKQGLMQRLLTSEARVAEFSSEPWQSFPLGELFAERNEVNQPDDLPLLSITADRGVIPRSEIDRKDSTIDDRRAYKRIRPGDIGYNTMRMWQGVSAMSQLDGVVSPAYTVCMPTSRIDGKFASYLFKFPPVVHLFHRYSQGLVDDTLSLKFPKFSEIEVTIPTLEEQRWIGRLLSRVDDLITLYRKYLECLRRQKTGITEKLLTGKIRALEMKVESRDCKEMFALDPETDGA